MLTTLESTATIVFIFLLCFVLSTYWVNYNNSNPDECDNYHQKNDQIMNTTMGMVLLVFAVPKLINMERFYNIYIKYDVISSRVPFYAKAYPVIELLQSMLLLSSVRTAFFAYLSILVTFGSSLVGTIVLLFVKGGGCVECGCLGGVLPMKLSVVSLTEGTLMVCVALYMVLVGMQREWFRID